MLSNASSFQGETTKYKTYTVTPDNFQQAAHKEAQSLRESTEQPALSYSIASSLDSTDLTASDVFHAVPLRVYMDLEETLNEEKLYTRDVEERIKAVEQQLLRFKRQQEEQSSLHEDTIRHMQDETAMQMAVLEAEEQSLLAEISKLERGIIEPRKARSTWGCFSVLGRCFGNQACPTNCFTQKDDQAVDACRLDPLPQSPRSGSLHMSPRSHDRSPTSRDMSAHSLSYHLRDKIAPDGLSSSSWSSTRSSMSRSVKSVPGARVGRVLTPTFSDSKRNARAALVDSHLSESFTVWSAEGGIERIDVLDVNSMSNPNASRSSLFDTSDSVPDDPSTTHDEQQREDEGRHQSQRRAPQQSSSNPNTRSSVQFAPVPKLHAPDRLGEQNRPQFVQVSADGHVQAALASQSDATSPNLSQPSSQVDDLQLSDSAWSSVAELPSTHTGPSPAQTAIQWELKRGSAHSPSDSNRGGASSASAASSITQTSAAESHSGSTPASSSRHTSTPLDSPVVSAGPTPSANSAVNGRHATMHVSLLQSPPRSEHKSESRVEAIAVTMSAASTARSRGTSATQSPAPSLGPSPRSDSKSALSKLTKTSSKKTKKVGWFGSSKSMKSSSGKGTKS